MEHEALFVKVLTGLLIFFGISGMVIPLLKRMHLSPVLGYLLAGVIIGPFGLSQFIEQIPQLQYVTIENTTSAQTLGELGIMALLFMIGLELSLQRLRELKRYVLGLGSLQILLCAAIIAGVALQFENSIETAILLGASLALSSTAIVMQLLSEKHLINRPVGVLSFSILLMQDLAVVPILILASTFGAQDDQSIVVTVIEALALAMGTLIVMYFVGKRFLRPLMNSLRFSKNPDILTAFILFMLVAFAMITHEAGLSAALGAFLVGLLIAETEFRHEIEVIIEPLKNLLLGLFFLSIGMMIDVRAILANPYWICLSVVGILCIKATVIYPLARLFSVPKQVAIKTAIVLSQPGEFAFLILSVGMYSGVIPTANGQFFLLVTAICMFITPLLFYVAPKLAYLVQEQPQGLWSFSDIEIHEDNHVIIAGFGRIGQIVGRTLEKQAIAYRAIDLNSELVHELQKEGLPVVYGDSRRSEQWRLLNADRARAVVIAIDKPDVAYDLLDMIRNHWPNLPVLMRARDTNSTQELYAIGAKLVVPEALESSLQLARGVMGIYEIDEDRIEEAIQLSRKQTTKEID
ncbi:MAG: hypothetical protein CMM93_04040 [Rickettsiales bacterium]|nr:hypothetical protein [Rickettsiales bacterium]|tara:strand:- start:2988 stop:4721 length:1734 start_codon:yes stop_codon:yes gene_type:complete